jgi:hypothetical protein
MSDDYDKVKIRYPSPDILPEGVIINGQYYPVGDTLPDWMGICDPASILLSMYLSIS